MKLLMFTIYDEKAEQFLPPFALPQKAMATRTFQHCVNDTDHAFGQNPADYTLFQIGEFDADKGMINGMDAKQSLGNGVEYRQAQAMPEQEALDRQYKDGEDQNPLQKELEKRAASGE